MAAAVDKEDGVPEFVPDAPVSFCTCNDLQEKDAHQYFGPYHKIHCAHFRACPNCKRDGRSHRLTCTHPVNTVDPERPRFYDLENMRQFEAFISGQSDVKPRPP